MDIMILFKNRKHDIKLFLLVFLFNLLSLSPLIIFSNIHYSIDTYGIQLYGSSVHLDAFLGSYRYFGAFVYWLVSLTGHNPIFNPLPDTVFYIFAGALAVTLLVLYLYKLFAKKCISRFIVIELSVLITAVNVWFTDVLSFPECILLTAVGLLCCFVGVIVFNSSDKLWKYLIAFCLFIVSAGTYQQFIPIFFIYTILILCIKQSQSDKKSIKELLLFYLKPFLFIVINSIIYYLIGVVIQKILSITPNPRASMSLQTVIDNINYFIRQQHSFLKGRGFFSSEVLTVCYILVFVVFIVSLILYWKKNHQTAKTVFIGLSFIAAYICAYLPGLVTTSHGTRTICALFSVFALFAIGAVALYQQRVNNIILICILFLVFALNIYKTVGIGINQIEGNTKEAAYADNIAYAIEKHEHTNKTSITSIGIAYDMHGDINAEALYVDYAIEPLLQIHVGKDIKYVEVPDNVFNTYFNDKDWTSYDAEEQIVFDKNIAYICVY